MFMIYHVDAKNYQRLQSKIYREIGGCSDCYRFCLHSEGYGYLKMNALHKDIRAI